MNFGPLTDETDAFRIMDEALDAGINFFDTADMYGSFLCDNGHHGWTEEIIGRWFRQGGGRRERVILATKPVSYTHLSDLAPPLFPPYGGSDPTPETEAFRDSSWTCLLYTSSG